MAAGTGERYAVVSCHVERLLDDRVWKRLRALLAHGPSGARVLPLLRPPDERAGEDETEWLARAREAAVFGPIGHHTHWTSPSHARPSDGEEPAERVTREGGWLRDQGLEPVFFCGGGWYTDARVAGAAASLGYVDSTPRATRPGYLAEDAEWAQLDRPARVRLPSGADALALPTTHSIGEAARAAFRGGLPQVVHVYLHDTDLINAWRRFALHVALGALARRCTLSDAAGLVAAVRDSAPAVPWSAIARGGGAAPSG